MLQTDFSERISLLITNYHLQAPVEQHGGFDAEEDRMDRLGRTLTTGAQAFRVRRLGNRRETLPTTLVVQLQHEASVLLKATPPGALFFIVISGHGVSGAGGEPCLLARDVYLHMRQHGMLPLNWFHNELDAARPAHTVIVYDIDFLDGTESDPATLVQRIGAPATPCTQIWLRRQQLPTRSTIQWLTHCFQGGALLPKQALTSVRSLVNATTNMLKPGTGPRKVAVRTSLADGDDIGLHAPSTVDIPAIRPAADEGLLDFRTYTLSPGTMLPNRIRVDEVIGNGGFGTVYLGEQVDLHRTVAIKVLHPLASVEPDSVGLFLREMWSIARLNHHNIVSIYHSGALPDGQIFYVMEHLSGETLRERLEREQRLSVDKAVDLVCQLLSGLEHAHSQGVVHRDIKPENLMVVPRPQHREGLVILDFGVARFKEDMTQTSTAGTPGYMREGPGTYHNDEQADLYSVGVVFFELIVGRRPDELREQSVSGALMEASVPPRIRKTLLKALATNPADGFLSAADFLEALQGHGRDVSDDTARIVRARQPFRSLTPFEPEEAHLFFGREQETEQLLDRLLFSRVLLLLGPSGVGRSSLLRAGVGPRCEQAGMWAAHGDLQQPFSEVVRRVSLGSATLRQAVKTAQFTQPRRIVLLLDHVESLFLAGTSREAERLAFEDQLVELLEDRSIDVSVLLSVREDVLPVMAALRRRLNLSPSQEFPLLPLGVTSAYHAITQPLRMARISIQGDLLAQLQRDLTVSCKELLPLATNGQPHVFPPHLQIAGQALYDSLEPGQSLLTLEHYQRLDRLPGILERHAKTVLSRYVVPQEVPFARRLLLELVAVDGSRQVRADADLRAVLEPTMSPSQVGGLLTLLHRHRIIQPHAVGGQLHWQLAHESYAAWVHRSVQSDEAEHKRLRELLLLRVRSPAAEPGLLNSEELNALNVHQELVEEVDREINQLPDARRPKWTVRKLVRKSRRRRATRRWTIIGLATLVTALWIGGFLSLVGDTKDVYGDMGTFYIRCTAFDANWDTPSNLGPEELPFLSMSLFELSPDNPAAVGQPVEATFERQQGPGTDPSGIYFKVRAPGGTSRMLRVSGRHRRGEAECRPSWILMARTPGNQLVETTDSLDRAIEVRVPTCRATRSRTVAVPAGVVLIPPKDSRDAPAEVVPVGEFRVDSVEVSRYQYLPYLLWAERNSRFGRDGDTSPFAIPEIQGPNLPATYVNASMARLYCLWWGMDLPTRNQWIKAARGGKNLDGDARALSVNNEPARRYPWGNLAPSLSSAGEPFAIAAFLQNDSKPLELLPVDSIPKGASPYGALHMADNVAEWTREFSMPNAWDSWPGNLQEALVMGGSYQSVDSAQLTVGNGQLLPAASTLPWVGFRCVEDLQAE